MNDAPPALPPILEDKHHEAASEFTPESLLREARRQRRLAPCAVPALCLLDPDGDIVRHLVARGEARADPGWACYHTELHRCRRGGLELGLVGCAVGAPFAVLVAEQLFASGCQVLISMTSAGRLKAVHPPPYFVLIREALRDEGTSYHYRPMARFSRADPALLERLDDAFGGLRMPVLTGGTWTTDAPYRETAEDIDRRTAEGLLAVEMEAAALYAFAEARHRKVICLAHVTNQMGQEGDFEKGEGDGVEDALAVVTAAAQRLL